MEKIAPVTSKERVHVVDVVRGMAILGILIVNMGFFFAPIYLEILGETWFDDGLSGMLKKGIVGFAQGKFITTFSLLFGLGLAIQYERFQTGERSFPGFWTRRMLALLAIGLIHALIVWWGDILTWYALIGLVLVFFRNCKPKTLKIWAVLLLLIPILLVGAFTALLGGLSMIPEAADQIATDVAKQRENLETLTMEARSSYPVAGLAETIRLNIAQWGQALVAMIFFLPYVLGMFLVGLLYGRYRIFHESRERVAWIREKLRWLLPVAILTNGLAAYLYGSFGNLMPNGRMLLYQIFLISGQIAGSTTYVFLLILAYHSPNTHRLVAPLGAVGRMALTNYLTHSIVFTTLANGYGFGLYGRISPLTGLLMTLGIFVVQIWLSNVWLARFRFGPMEWLWRSLTYGRAQPMRRAG